MPLAEAKELHVVLAGRTDPEDSSLGSVPFLRSVLDLLQPDSQHKTRLKLTVRVPASAHESHSSFAASCGPDCCRFDSFASRLQ